MRNFGRRLRGSKGLRAFAFEVAVVVIGVLIALGAQELADDWSWQRKVEQGNALLADEALRNLGTSVEFYSAAPCMAAQVDKARQNLAQRGPRASLAAYADDFGRFVVRTPLRPLYESTWSSFITDGTLAHMGAARFGSYSRFYETSNKLSESAIIADEQAQGLLVLTRPLPLDAASTARLAEQVERLDQTIAFARVVAIRNVHAYRDLGMTADAKRIEAFLATSPTLVACRAEGLPIADWRKASGEALSPMAL